MLKNIISFSPAPHSLPPLLFFYYWTPAIKVSCILLVSNISTKIFIIRSSERIETGADLRNGAVVSIFVLFVAQVHNHVMSPAINLETKEVGG